MNVENDKLIRLAEKYGYEMELYGKSLYWTSPRQCRDTTEQLKNNPLFKQLSKENQEIIFNYGNLRKIWGMGCYQDRGFNAEWYNKGIPPVNPFETERDNIGRDEEER